jgi:hypothetical protein
MSTLQVNTIQTNTPAGVLAVRDSNDALTSIQPGAMLGTAANTAPVFQDSAGTEIGTLARAWVYFNGTGTPAIQSAFNVSSITDNGTGSYTVNFTRVIPATGCPVASCNNVTVNTNFGINVNGINTTSVGVYCVENGSPTDKSQVFVAVFR